jgi:hypothetical protein
MKRALQMSKESHDGIFPQNGAPDNQYDLKNSAFP